MISCTRCKLAGDCRKWKDLSGSLWHMDLFQTNPSYLPFVRNNRRALLRRTYDAGPHPNARWVRRSPFVNVLVCCDFKPLPARKAYLLTISPLLPPDAKIPPVQIGTPEQCRKSLHGCIFANPDICTLIASLPVSHQVCVCCLFVLCVKAVVLCRLVIIVY